MASQNPQQQIYDPKTLAVMDEAFVAIWHVLKTDDPFRDYANDSELRCVASTAFFVGSEVDEG